MKFLFTCTFILLGIFTFSQSQDSILPAYKRFPTVPPLQLLLGDSATKYTKENLPKKKPVLIMLFSPDCDHCQREAEELVKHKDEIKDIQLIMVTTSPIWKMNEFVTKYRLNEIKNIVVGRDFYYLLPSFFDIHNFPFLALYNKKGNLIEGLEGAYPVEKLMKFFKD